MQSVLLQLQPRAKHPVGADLVRDQWHKKTRYWHNQPRSRQTAPDMIYINISNLEDAMLEFVGLTAIIYLFLMGVARLFRGKTPEREIYIIREYEIQEVIDESEKEEPLSAENELRSPGENLPDNVVPLHRKT